MGAVCSCCRARRVGYYISAGSRGFSSQADHACAFQYLYFLFQNGVPPEDIIIWLPTEDGITVKEPRGCLTGPRLVPPEGYENCIRREVGGFEDATEHLAKLFERDEFTELVWVFLDHGQKDHLNFDQDRMPVDGFNKALRHKEGRRRKNVLVIIDACYSSIFARDALRKRDAPERTSILSSSATICFTSGILISDNDELMNVYSGTDGPLKYAVQSSMFTRELLDIICYTDFNPKLSELSSVLNWRAGSGNGFKAEYHEKNARNNLRLRDFFPGPVLPEGQVRVGNQYYEFQEVIPKKSANIAGDGSNGFFDDFRRCTQNVSDWQNHYLFVQIALNSNGEVIPIRYGKLDPNNSQQKAIIENIQYRRGLPESEQALLHVDIQSLIEKTLEEVEPRAAREGLEEKK
jgi:hypothetical protein